MGAQVRDVEWFSITPPEATWEYPICLKCGYYHHPKAASCDGLRNVVAGTDPNKAYEGEHGGYDYKTCPCVDCAALRDRETKAAMAEGRKDDSQKDCRPGLIAPEMTIGIGKVLAFGAKKYAAGNWAKGMDWSRPIDALDRHWSAWKSGEKHDPETGYSHLWHVGCCLMFLIAYEARGIGRDNRVEIGIMRQGAEKSKPVSCGKVPRRGTADMLSGAIIRAAQQLTMEICVILACLRYLGVY